MAKIVIVDDHKMVMESLQYMIEYEGKHQVIGKFPLANDFLNELKTGNLDFEVLILDIKLPDLSGIEVAKILNENFPEVKTILLSQYKNKEFVLAGLQEGVQAYLLKSCAGDELLQAIDSVLNNQTYLSQEIASSSPTKQKLEKNHFKFNRKRTSSVRVNRYGIFQQTNCSKIRN
jgi:DNA-binding NarL/FixJ family response regulator